MNIWPLYRVVWICVDQPGHMLTPGLNNFLTTVTKYNHIPYNNKTKAPCLFLNKVPFQSLSFSYWEVSLTSVYFIYLFFQVENTSVKFLTQPVKNISPRHPERLCVCCSCVFEISFWLRKKQTSWFFFFYQLLVHTVILYANHYVATVNSVIIRFFKALRSRWYSLDHEQFIISIHFFQSLWSSLNSIFKASQEFKLFW